MFGHNGDLLCLLSNVQGAQYQLYRPHGMGPMHQSPKCAKITPVRHVFVFCSMIFFYLYRTSDFADSVSDLVVLKTLMSYLKLKVQY